MSIQSFGTTWIPLLGLPLESLKEKWHSDVVLAEKHKVYYKEGNDASSQRLRIMWSLCLRLSLLNTLHNFHLTCTNHPFFLVVQVDLILKSCLWVCHSPILELQHTLLPPKVSWVRKCAPTFFSFRCFIMGPTFGSFEEFGGTSWIDFLVATMQHWWTLYIW
jgi:hypothetical protein